VTPATPLAVTAIDLLYGDAAAAREIVDQFQPAMTKDAYLVLQRGLLKTCYARQRINRRGRDWFGLAFEIDRIAHRERNRAWGRRAIPDRRRDDTPDGGDVKFQPRLIEVSV
jgi:hypothetical protein